MLFERGTRNLIGVFRRHGQHDSALAQIESHALYCKVGLAGGISLGNLDPFQAVVSDDPAPDCVVKIEYQEFCALTAERGDNTGNVIGIERNEFVRKGKLGQIPKSRVMPVCKTDGLRNSGDV